MQLRRKYIKFITDFRKKCIYFTSQKCMYICKRFQVYVCEAISACILRNVTLISKYLSFIINQQI